MDLSEESPINSAFKSKAEEDAFLEELNASFEAEEEEEWQQLRFEIREGILAQIRHEEWRARYRWRRDERCFGNN